MEEAGWLKGTATTAPVLVANFPGVDPAVAVGLAARLRAAGIGAEVFPDPIQVGKQMGYGSARGHRLAVIVGPDEAAKRGLQPPRPGDPAGAEGDPLGRPGDCGDSRAWRSPDGGRVDERRADRPEPGAERPSTPSAGTRDWLPGRLRPARPGSKRSCSTASPGPGYEPMRTPVLESTELHERKSGAGIVSKLFELAGGRGQGGVCLRPELTAGIVRAYTGGRGPARPALAGQPRRAGLPLRDAPARPAPRVPAGRRRAARRRRARSPTPRSSGWPTGRWPRPGVTGATIRLGHVGLILEMLERSGLPRPPRLGPDRDAQRGRRRGAGRRRPGAGPGAALRLAPGGRRRPSEIPAAGRAGPTTAASTASSARSSRSSPAGGRATRSSTGCGASGTSATACSTALERVRDQVHDLADLKGPAGRRSSTASAATYEALAPDSVAALRALVATLGRLRGRPRPGRARPRVRPGDRVLLADGLRARRADARRARSRSAAAAATTAWPASSAATATTAGSASPSAWSGSPACSTPRAEAPAARRADAGSSSSPRRPSAHAATPSGWPTELRTERAVRVVLEPDRTLDEAIAARPRRSGLAAGRRRRRLGRRRGSSTLAATGDDRIDPRPARLIDRSCGRGSPRPGRPTADDPTPPSTRSAWPSPRRGTCTTGSSRSSRRPATRSAAPATASTRRRSPATRGSTSSSCGRPTS